MGIWEPLDFSENPVVFPGWAREGQIETFVLKSAQTYLSTSLCPETEPAGWQGSTLQATSCPSLPSPPSLGTWHRKAFQKRMTLRTTWNDLL